MISSKAIERREDNIQNFTCWIFFECN